MIHDENTKKITTMKELGILGLNLHRFWWFYSFVFSAFNPLNPNIKIKLLLPCPHTFIIAVVGRSCENFKRIHLGWSYLKFSRPLWWLKHWHQKEKFYVDPLLGLKGLMISLRSYMETLKECFIRICEHLKMGKKKIDRTAFFYSFLCVWISWQKTLPRVWYTHL